VSDARQITCPECQTSQSAKAPFCENCGYRIRRSDTVKEGHQVITPDKLCEARKKRLGRTKQPGTDTPVGADGSADGPNTYIEGLHAVELGDEKTEAESAAESAEFPSDVSQSSLIDRPAAADTSGKLIVYMAIWMSLTAVAVLATYFLTATLANEKARAPTPSELPDKVKISEGPFLRGLEGDVRSFILQMCQKVEDDPDETCKEKKLLRGEYPEETVKLAAFSIGATEVTVADFHQCTAANACDPIDFKDCEVWTHQGRQISLRVPKALQATNMPVTCAHLDQAKAYCKWNGGALPSSDQWEKAARGTEGKLFPWGTSWSSDIANWGEMDVAQNPIVGKLDGFEWTAPPGNFAEGKSPFGAYDMAGNVAEWVDTGDTDQAVARGGSWTSHPFDLRTTHRLEIDADARRTDVGFRCAYD
jgi:formylglycine-generating enzyme required for sulfatase activity